MDLLSKLSVLSVTKQTDPREIFMSLPRKHSSYAYPRDVQSDVWGKWYNDRNQKNTIIKMNTGSGKTVVGLMILQSSLNEGVGPAIYVVPDKYLVQQVIAEAERLGIKATDNREDYNYTECNAILVTSIHTLVNGKSVFGMRDSNNYPIGSIIIDDVHACLETISKQFSVIVKNCSSAYKEIQQVLSELIIKYDPHTYSEVFEEQSPKTRLLVPFWIWQTKEKEIYRILQSHMNDEDDIRFSLPLVQNCFPVCNCVITSKAIEISPLGNDISLIKSFQNARRRIFMSATLADDSVFISALGLKESKINNIIAPSHANDIGTRLILFPKHLNNMIQDDEIRTKAAEIAKKYNIVVIVPSHDHASLWRRYTENIVDKDNIWDAVNRLKTEHVGLVVFVNRYDGIDLPDDACRMLIIDSLPPLNKEYTKYVHSICMDSKHVVRAQMQRIEQGMGRGVRSSTDSCCIVFMGSNLADVLIRQKGVNFFSNATRVQYELSKQLWGLLKEEKNEPSIDDIFEIASYSLQQQPVWIQQCKAALADITYSTEPQIDATESALRIAFEEYLNHQVIRATEKLDPAIQNAEENSLKGYLLQIKATYMNIFDPVKSQELLLSAKKCNRGVLNPIEGYQHQKITNTQEQVHNIIEYTKSIYQNQQTLIIHLQKLLSDLSFQSDADIFESALEEIGKLLGFISIRPDRDTKGEGPDNLWALGNGKYWVIECKNESNTSDISKDYCNQLGGSVRWFIKEYHQEFTANPILIHKSNRLSEKASPVEGMRIINEKYLDRLKEKVYSFYKALISLPDWSDEKHISNLLSSYELTPNALLQSCTINYIQ